jgi:predicted transcriptional regulator
MTKRTFEEIRNAMIVELARGKSTINDLAKKSGVNWKTTQNHLIFLVGTGLASEVFNSEYVRIFEITDKGKTYAEQLQQMQQKRSAGQTVLRKVMK